MIKVLRTLLATAHKQDSSRWKPCCIYPADAESRSDVETAGDVLDLDLQAHIERAIVEQHGTASRAVDSSVATDSTSVP